MELVLNEKPLTPAEQDRLGELEGVIHKNLKAWFAVGMAMIEIRDKRLYRNEEGRTWEGYCREIFDMSHQHADRQIAAAKVIENLTPIGVTDDGKPDWELLPANEAQARELARLQPEEQRDIWESLIEEKREGKQVKVTAKAVKEAIKGLKGNGLAKALKKAIEGVQPRKKVDPLRESDEFKLAWVTLMDRIGIEGRSGWRHTSREAVFNALGRLLKEIGDGTGPWLQDKAIPLRRENREKLIAAGWLLLHKSDIGSSIQQLCDDGSWLIYAEYETVEQRDAAFEDALLEGNTIKV